MDEKSLIEVKNGRISILNQDLCGADGACALICTVNAIKLAKRKVKLIARTTAIKNGYILDLFNEIKGKIMYIFIKYRIAVKALPIPN
jgi:MinD superfamily P-loop ATPase